MKRLIILFTFFLFTDIYCQTDTLTINGTKFLTIIKPVKNNDFDRTDTILELYRVENGKPKYLLQHYLYLYGADCNNEFTDIGKYSVQNDSILFFTTYKQKTGLDPIPLARKQLYRVNENGKLVLIFDKVQDHFSKKWVDKK